MEILDSLCGGSIFSCFTSDEPLRPVVGVLRTTDVHPAIHDAICDRMQSVSNAVRAVNTMPTAGMMSSPHHGGPGVSSTFLQTMNPATAAAVTALRILPLKSESELYRRVSVYGGGPNADALSAMQTERAGSGAVAAGLSSSQSLSATTSSSASSTPAATGIGSTTTATAANNNTNNNPAAVGGLKAMRGILKSSWYAKHQRRVCSVLVVTFNLDALIKEHQQQHLGPNAAGFGGGVGATGGAASPAFLAPSSAYGATAQQAGELQHHSAEHSVLDPAADAAKHRNLIEASIVGYVDRLRETHLKGSTNTRLVALLVASCSGRDDMAAAARSGGGGGGDGGSAAAGLNPPLSQLTVWDPARYPSHAARPLLTFDELCSSVRYRCRIEHCGALALTKECDELLLVNSSSNSSSAKVVIPPMPKISWSDTSSSSSDISSSSSSSSDDEGDEKSGEKTAEKKTETAIKKKKTKKTTTTRSKRKEKTKSEQEQQQQQQPKFNVRFLDVPMSANMLAYTAAAAAAAANSSSPDRGGAGTAHGAATASPIIFAKLNGLLVEAALRFHRDEYARVKKLKDDRTAASELDLHKIAVRRRVKIAWHSEVLRDAKTAIHNYDRARFELSQVPLSLEAIFVDAVLLLRRLRFSDLDVLPRFIEQLFQLLNLAENFDVRLHYPGDSTAQTVARLLLFHLAAEMFQIVAHQIVTALPAVPGIDSSVIFLCRGPNRPLPTSIALHAVRSLLARVGILRRIRELTQFTETALRKFGSSEDPKKRAAPAVPAHEYLGQFSPRDCVPMLSRIVSTWGPSRVSQHLADTLVEIEKHCTLSPRMWIMMRLFEAEHCGLAVDSCSTIGNSKNIKDENEITATANDNNINNSNSVKLAGVQSNLVRALGTEPVMTYGPLTDWVHVGLERCLQKLQAESEQEGDEKKAGAEAGEEKKDNNKKRSTSPEVEEPLTVAAAAAAGEQQMQQQMQRADSSSQQRPPPPNPLLQHPPTGNPITAENLFTPAFYHPAYHTAHLALGFPDQVSRRQSLAAQIAAGASRTTLPVSLSSSSSSSSSASASLLEEAVAAALRPRIICRVRFPSAFYEPEPSGIVARVELSSASGSYFPEQLSVSSVALNLKITTTNLRNKQTLATAAAVAADDVDAIATGGGERKSPQQQQPQQQQQFPTNSSFAFTSSLQHHTSTTACTVTVPVTSTNTYFPKQQLLRSACWQQVVEIGADALQRVITPQVTCVTCESVDADVVWPDQQQHQQPQQQRREGAEKANKTNNNCNNDNNNDNNDNIIIIKVIRVRGIPTTSSAAVPELVTKIVKGGQSVVDTRTLACGAWLPAVVFLSPKCGIKLAVLSDSGALEGEDFRVRIGWRADCGGISNSSNNSAENSSGVCSSGNNSKKKAVERLLWTFSIHSALFELASDIKYSNATTGASVNIEAATAAAEKDGCLGGIEEDNEEEALKQLDAEDIYRFESSPPISWAKDTGRTRDAQIHVVRGEQNVCVDDNDESSATTASGFASIPLHCMRAGRYRIPFRVVYVTELESKYADSAAAAPSASPALGNNNSNKTNSKWKIQRCVRGYVFLHVRNPLLTVTTVRKAASGHSLLTSSLSNNNNNNQQQQPQDARAAAAAQLQEIISETAPDGGGAHPSHCIPAESELARFVEIADQKLATCDVRAASLPYVETCQAVHDSLFRVPFVDGTSLNDQLLCPASADNIATAAANAVTAAASASPLNSIASAFLNTSFAVTGDRTAAAFPLIDTGLADPIPQHKQQSVTIRQELPRMNTTGSTSYTPSPLSGNGATPPPLVVVAGEHLLLLSTFTNHEAFPIVVHSAAPAMITGQRPVRLAVVSSSPLSPLFQSSLSATAAAAAVAGQDSSSSVFPVTLRPHESVCVATVAEVVIDTNTKTVSTIAATDSYSENIQLGSLAVVISRQKAAVSDDGNGGGGGGAKNSSNNNSSAPVINKFLKKRQQPSQLVEYTSMLPTAARVYEPRVKFECAWPPVAQQLSPFILRISLKNLRPFAQKIAIRIGGGGVLSAAPNNNSSSNSQQQQQQTTNGPLGFGHGVTVVPTGRVNFVVDLAATPVGEDVLGNGAGDEEEEDGNNNISAVSGQNKKIFFVKMIPTESGTSVIPPIEAKIFQTGQQQSGGGGDGASPNLLLSSVVEKRVVFVSP